MAASFAVTILVQQAVLAKLDIKALSGQPKHLGCSHTVVPGQANSGLDTHLFDNVRGFRDNFFKGGGPDQLHHIAV